MKNQTTNAEQELENKLFEIILDAGLTPREQLDYHVQLIQNEREKILERVAKEVIGEINEHIGNGNHVNCTECDRNRLKTEQHKKLAALAQKEE